MPQGLDAMTEEKDANEPATESTSNEGHTKPSTDSPEMPDPTEVTIDDLSKEELSMLMADFLDNVIEDDDAPIGEKNGWVVAEKEELATGLAIAFSNLNSSE